MRAGEIVGIAGVAGNGQSELLEAIAGIRPSAGASSIRADRSRMPSPGAPPGSPTCRRTGCAWAWSRDFPAYENAILGYHVDPDYSRPRLPGSGAIIGTCLR